MVVDRSADHATQVLQYEGKITQIEVEHQPFHHLRTGLGVAIVGGAYVERDFGRGSPDAPFDVSLPTSGGLLSCEPQRNSRSSKNQSVQSVVTGRHIIVIMGPVNQSASWAMIRS